MKKIYALNASPRKGWNCDQILDSFIEGVRETATELEIEKVQLYDLDYKGCRSCFACQMKKTEQGHCLFRDGATELIRGIKSGDGLVFAAPVYYFDVPSQMRAILERLFYPGDADHEIPVTAIYTMNQPEEVANRVFKKRLEDISFFFRQEFKTEPEQLYVYNTLHWRNPERYSFPMEWYEQKQRRHDEQFPQDLRAAKEAGVRFAQKVAAR